MLLILVALLRTRKYCDAESVALGPRKPLEL